MKIFLLNPPSPKNTEYVRVDRCMQKKSAWASSLWQPLSIMYAQAILDKNGYETILKDATAEQMKYKETLEFILKEKPDILVLNSAVPTIFNDCQIALDIKEKLPKIKTVIVGAPTYIIPEIIADYNLDYGIIGDSEYAILDIVQSNFSKFVVREIKNTKFIEHFIENLDEIPPPSLKHIHLEKYIMPFTKEKLMLVEPGRGCPFNCAFCIVPPLAKRRVRYRNPIKFVKELEKYYKGYKVKNFLFWTETATLNKKFMIKICQEIIRRGLKIKWMTTSRTDTVDEELLTIMKKAGCWLISYGIESCNQNILDIIDKGTSVESAKKAIEIAHRSGIKVMAHVIIGLPKQTKKSIQETVYWLIKNKVDYAQFYCAVPYKGTKLRAIAEQNNWIESNDPRKYEIDNAVMRNEFMSTKEIEEMREWAFSKFYLRPEKILKEIIDNKFNPFYISYFFKDGFHFFKHWVSIKKSHL